MKNILVALCCFSFISCEKFLKVDSPPGQLGGEAIYTSDITATSAMLAVYTILEADGVAFNFQNAAGISADEMLDQRHSDDYIALAANNLGAENSAPRTIWSQLYKAVYQSNAVLEGVENSAVLSTKTRTQLRGEALFTRAWCHFYLTAFFDRVPYVTGTDPFANVKLQQLSAEESFAMMVKDLAEARTLLSEDYVTAQNLPGGERVRPNRSAADALLARIYLYQSRWADAANAASLVIGQSSRYRLVTDLSAVFLRNSPEAIWQWQVTTPNFNTADGAYLINPLDIPLLFSLRNSFYFGFDPADQRRLKWTRQTVFAGETYYWPHKYKVGQNAPTVTEYSILLRLSELYLIRAEAHARQGSLTQAADDLHAIRDRAGLPRLDFTDPSNALEAIWKERRFELFSETGDRWFDLRRTGKIDEVMNPLKAPNWTSTDALYPIPLTEMLRHPGMQQNPGY